MWRLEVLIVAALMVVTVQAQSNPSGAVEPRSTQVDSNHVIANVAQTQRKAVITEVVASQIVPLTQSEDPRQKLERAAIVNAVTEHQLALRRDTEKLLFLAEELKQHVDKTGPNVLSMDVIKKAQEIEKLAKSVKERMKFAY